MLFNSLTFFVFFIVVVTVLRLLPSRGIARNVWILFASCVFYASWNAAYLLLLLVTALVDYGVADRVLFGSDFPTYRPADCLDRFRRLATDPPAGHEAFTPELIDAIIDDRPLSLLGLEPAAPRPEEHP